EATSWLEKAIQHAPQTIENYIALAELARGELDEPQRADRAMDALVEANNRSARAYLARWRYRIPRDRAGAEEDVARARELAPDEAEVLMAAALVAEQHGDRAEAQKLLERGITLHPRDERLYQARAELNVRAGQ